MTIFEDIIWVYLTAILLVIAVVGVTGWAVGHYLL